MQQSYLLRANQNDTPYCRINTNTGCAWLMALNHIHLRKLLKILFLDNRSRIAELRKDIREERVKSAGHDASGADFYVPFWADAKSHVFGLVDLQQATDERIALNRSRRNIYPLLRDGFLVWWDRRRRWTNTPFTSGQRVKTQFQFPGLDAIVKIDNILSVQDGRGVEHFVYPYFSPHPPLSDEAARLGLWLLIQALPTVPPNEIRILDVIRGQTFSLDRHPLRGQEEQIFRNLYHSALLERQRLEEEYD